MSIECNPFTVLGLLGIKPPKVLPVSVDCPLCKARGKLEIRSSDNIRCARCLFHDDVISLYAQAQGIELRPALALLAGYGVVGDGFSSFYLSQRPIQDAMRAFLSERAEAMMEDRTWVSGVNRLLYTDINPQDFLKLRHAAVWAWRTHFEDVEYLLPPKLIARAMRAWGKGPAVILPSYSGAYVSGMWIITGADAVFMPISDTDSGGACFTPLVSLSTARTVVVDDPVEALRLTAWSAMTNTEPQPFVHPVGNHRLTEYSGHLVVHWSPTGDLGWLLRAASVPGSAAVHYPVTDGNIPFDGNWRTLCSVLDRQYLNGVAAAGAALSGATDAQIRGAFAQVPASPYLRQQIVATIDGPDRRRVEHIVRDMQGDNTAVVGGKPVTATDDGWVIGGEVVSQAVILLDSLEPVGNDGEAIITGNVLYSGATYPFRDDIDRVQRNTGDWLRKFLVANAGAIYTPHPKWGKRLLEIANAFHRPKPVLAEGAYGWRGTELFTPNFVVSTRGIEPVKVGVSGPAIPYPVDLTQAEQLEESVPSARRLIAALLASLLRTSRKLPPIGMYLVNERHILPLLADTFGASVQQTVTSADIQREQSPLPTLYGTFDTKLAEQPLNAVLNVDTATEKVLRLRGGWIRVSGAGIRLLGVLRKVWQALPGALKELERNDGRVMDAVAASLGATYADEVERLRNDIASATASLTDRLFALATTEDLGVATDDGVRLTYRALQNTVRGSQLSLPPSSEILAALKESRVLLNTPDASDAWVIKASDWSLYRAYAQI